MPNFSDPITYPTPLGTGNGEASVIQIDPVSGSILIDGNKIGVLFGGKVGYGPGTGGAVTQLTSKATGVSLNALNGTITMNNASLAAGAAVSFVLTDSSIGANDFLNLQHQSGGTIGAYTFNAVCAAGSATITVRNITAGALAEAIVLQFTLLKGSVT